MAGKLPIRPLAHVAAVTFRGLEGAAVTFRGLEGAAVAFRATKRHRRREGSPDATNFVLFARNECINAIASNAPSL